MLFTRASERETDALCTVAAGGALNAPVGTFYTRARVMVNVIASVTLCARVTRARQAVAGTGTLTS